MKYCAQCGSQVTGAFCHQCGASVSEDAVPTAGPAASGGDETWHEVPTHISEQPATPYAGYQSGGYQTNGYNSAGYAAAGGTGYASGGGYVSGGTGAAPMPPPKKSRSNLLLAGLVALAALVVVGLVGFLMTRSGSSKPNSAPTPSGSSKVASPTPSSTSSASSAPTQTQPSSPAPNVPQSSQPATEQSVQNSSTSSSPSESESSQSSSGSDWSSMPGTVDDTNGDYAVSNDGSAAYVYKKVSGGLQRVGTLTLRGYEVDPSAAAKQGVSMIQLPGCTAPTVVWNDGSGDGSAAFGLTTSGQYARYVSSGPGQYDLTPTGGDGSEANDFGVYNKGDHISYRSRGSSKSDPHNIFSSCESDGSTLHYSGVGD